MCENGAKVQHFEFAATGAAIEKPTTINNPFRKNAKIRIGTIRLTLTRCVLEQVQSTSDKVATWGHQASKADADKASHFTKLGSIRFDAPRKAYRLKSEQADPWCTYLFV